MKRLCRAQPAPWHTPAAPHQPWQPLQHRLMSKLRPGPCPVLSRQQRLRSRTASLFASIIFPSGPYRNQVWSQATPDKGHLLQNKKKGKILLSPSFGPQRQPEEPQSQNSSLKETKVHQAPWDRSRKSRRAAQLETFPFFLCFPSFNPYCEFLLSETAFHTGRAERQVHP